MPDAKAGSWAALNGEEFVNSQRTIDYINNIGLPIVISNDCWCPNIQELLAGCDPTPTDYYLPGSDTAPWFDPAIAESSAFLGFLPVEFTGLGSTFTRSTFDTLNGGAVLGRLRPQARTLTWRGFLFGTNCCATEYGLRWLTATLAGGAGCDGCDGAELDILLCCPETIDCDDCDASAGVGPLTDAFRNFQRVGLIDGPKRLSERQLGCNGSCGSTTSCGDCQGCIIEIEFSLIAGNPYMHKDTQVVCNTLFPSCDDACDPFDPVFIEVATTSYPASTADGQKCLDSLDCSATGPVLCTVDPTCPTATLPTIPDFVDPCGCDPLINTTVCCAISNDIYGQFFEGVPTIDISAGPDEPLHNVLVNFYENPQERDCTDPDMFQSDCFKCSSLTVRYIAPNTTITIDGLTRRVTAKCAGTASIPAENLTVSPFKWPILKCISYIITVTADCAFTVDPTSSVTISVTPREM